MSSSTEVAPNHIANIPVPVLFIEKGKAVVMGLTKGHAVIFNAKSGRKVALLDHGSASTWVTALAYVFPTGGSQMLATGDRNCELNTRIKVWIEDSDELDNVGNQMTSDFFSNPKVTNDSVAAVLSFSPSAASSGEQIETASESGSSLSLGHLDKQDTANRTTSDPFIVPSTAERRNVSKIVGHEEIAERTITRDFLDLKVRSTRITPYFTQPVAVVLNARFKRAYANAG
ncbi:hypothetical protein BDP27DRAFT_1364599 [Rhodocollybia butyracea]|uniref:Uncharacterized protein n=1 Tax=Rhodocollybia butyracea TaxID=206335 RepID=A0A9P5PPT0_9AGAR|nr:hypothetical protein BDP27DRAFT_1364599 [Rhodocollybia butyracea]